MDFGITADSWWETKVSDTLSLIPQREFKDFFFLQNYGSDLNEIFIVLMCRHPENNFKQRIRFVKKEKALYLDIMLDFDLFLTLSQEERNKIIFDKLKIEVPEIINRYKFKDFNTNEFSKDWTQLINQIEY